MAWAMSTPEATRDHYARQQRLTAAALTAARSSWSQISPDSLDRSWLTVGPRLLVTTARVQRAAALDAIAYIPRVLDELEIDAQPAGRVAAGAFVGVASDGRSLNTLLREPLIRSKELFGKGASSLEAMAGGLASLERIIATQIPDAARGATGVGIASRPRLGYVRMLNTPSCARCAVLAGKFFQFNQGFQRHPRCDCRHIPAQENAAGDLRTDPRAAFQAGQVRGLSKADEQAIRAGADLGRVVNFSGVNAAGTRRAAGARLTPEQICRAAGDDRERAIELLRSNGFLI